MKTNASSLVTSHIFIGLATVLIVLSVRYSGAAPAGGKNQKETDFQDVSVSIELFTAIPGSAEPTAVQSDDGTPYVDNKRAKVTAYVGRRREIRLVPNDSAKSDAGRTLFLDLSDPVGCQTSPATDASGDGVCEPCDELTGALVLPNTRYGDTTNDPDPLRGLADNVERFEIINGNDLDDMPVGCSFVELARIMFVVAGERWWLIYGPFDWLGGPNHCPDSDPVRVTRVSADEWQFETTGEHRACLFRDDDQAGEYLYFGQFHVPYAGRAIALESQPQPAGACPTSSPLGPGPCTAGEGGGAGLEPSIFLRGDADFDGTVELTDPLATLQYLLFDATAHRCPDAADANDDGSVDLSDAVFTLSFLFRDGPAFPEPYPRHGVDATPDGLDCRR